jgi:hypothetical protein
VGNACYQEDERAWFCLDCLLAQDIDLAEREESFEYEE